MNNRHQNIPDAEIDRMVRDYFDCTLSTSEERRLAQRLAEMPDSSLTGERREALAAMSLAHMVTKGASNGHLKPSSTGRNTARSRWFAGAAATVALLISGILGFRHFTSETDISVCYAYVGGNIVTDHADIADMLAAQLADMAEADERMNRSVEDEMAELAAAIDNFHNDKASNL